MAESLGNGVEARRFRLVPERVVRVRPVDDLGQEDDGRVAVDGPSVVLRARRLAWSRELATTSLVARPRV